MKSKGKCFSMANMGQRLNDDRYFTHYSLTNQLFENYNEFDFNKTILEPACGEGHIVKILKQNFKHILAFDLSTGLDFLGDFFDPVPQIITNPPFKYAFEFILRCKEVCEDRFALLLPLSYLHGLNRYDYIYNNQNYIMSNKRYELIKKRKLNKKNGIYYTIEEYKFKYDLIQSKDFRLKYVYNFVRYPMLGSEVREDGKYITGMQVYAWYIWDSKYKGEPIHRWINNQKYVLAKKDIKEN